MTAGPPPTACPRLLGGFSPAFVAVWAGQTLSSLGSMLTSFAMGVSVFQTSGRTLDFAAMVAALLLPSALLAPWAGVVADRVDRRLLTCGGDGISAACAVLLALVVSRGDGSPWQLIALGFVSTSAQAVQAPACQALCASLVTPGHGVRANGLIGLTSNASRAIAPPLAAVLVGRVGLHGVVWIDLSTFAMGTALTLFALRGQPRQGIALGWRALLPAAVFAEVGSFLNDVWNSRAMTLLMVYSTLQSVLLGLVFCLVTPLMLAGHSTDELANVMAIAAVGAMAGSAGLAFTNPTGAAVRALVCCDGVASVCVLAVGLCGRMDVILVAAFVAQACAAAAAGLTASLWLRRVPSQRWGQMFASLGMIASLAMPLGLVAGSWWVDEAPSTGGATSTVDRLGFLFVVIGGVGVAMTAAFAAALATPRIATTWPSVRA